MIWPTDLILRGITMIKKIYLYQRISYTKMIK